MQTCLSYCLVGAAFLGSMILTMLSSKKSKRFNDFMVMLDEEQKQIYKSVIDERMSIYIQGMVLGIVVGIIVVFNSKVSHTIKVCMFITIALGINYFYYILYPKSTHMLEHLSSVEQNVAWLGIYKEMILRSHIGAVMGILGYMLIGRGMCA